MRILRTAALTGAALLSATALTTVAAGAAQADDGILPRRTALQLTVYSAVDDRLGRSVTLTCAPAGGTHPDPKNACELLAKVDGDFTKLSLSPGPCPRVYRPVIAVEQGVWQGRRVAYKKTYGNDCELLAATGAVFKF